jgi:hypothetical protein
MTVASFTNVKVSIYNDNATLFCLSWEHDGARYYVWIDRHSYTIEADPTFHRRPTLYMTRPQGVRVGWTAIFVRASSMPASMASSTPCSPTPSAPGYSKPPSPRSKHANATKPTGMLRDCV